MGGGGGEVIRQNQKKTCGSRTPPCELFPLTSFRYLSPLSHSLEKCLLVRVFHFSWPPALPLNRARSVLSSPGKALDMLSAPLARAEEREAGAPEREAGAEAIMPRHVASIPVAEEGGGDEAAEQPAQQQPSVPLASPTALDAPIDTALPPPAEGEAPSDRQATGSGEAQIDAKDHQKSLEAPPPLEQAPAAAASGCSNHRVRAHLAGNAAAIAQVITSGGSTEAKVAQRVVNRSGQKALQGFFSEVFETVTAS